MAKETGDTDDTDGTVLGGTGGDDAVKAAAEAAKATEAAKTVGGAEAAAEAAKVAEAAKAVAEAAKTADATKVADAAKATTSKAPDSYSDFTLPEGFQWLDGQLEVVQKLGKDNNLPQEAMQNLIDFNAASVQQALEGHSEAGQQQWQDMQEGWVETIKKDPELGGDNLEATIINGRKAVQAFGKMVETKGEDGKASLGKDGKPIMVNDLAQALELTGAGSHPVVVRAFSVLGKLVGEGGVVHGNMMPHAKSTAQRLYAKSNMNP